MLLRWRNRGMRSGVGRRLRPFRLLMLGTATTTSAAATTSATIASPTRALASAGAHSKEFRVRGVHGR